MVAVFQLFLVSVFQTRLWGWTAFEGSIKKEWCVYSMFWITSLQNKGERIIDADDMMKCENDSLRDSPYPRNSKITGCAFEWQDWSCWAQRDFPWQFWFGLWCLVNLLLQGVIDHQITNAKPRACFEIVIKHYLYPIPLDTCITGRVCFSVVFPQVLLIYHAPCLYSAQGTYFHHDRKCNL